MTIFLPRSAWTNHGPAVKLTPLTAAPLRGFAIHWPGDGADHIDATKQAHIAALLEGERGFHVHTRGWSDIAYQYAIDLAGRVWELRGARYQSAANGNQAVNKSHGAVTLLLGSKDKPSPEMIRAVQEFRQKVWLPLWPKATRVVGHRDLYSTDCPGPAAYALVKAGIFTRSSVQPPKPPVVPPGRTLTAHINHLLNLEAQHKLTAAQAAELNAWRHDKTWPPKPPTPVRKPLVTNYVFGIGSDAYVASTLAATHGGLLQVFQKDQAIQAVAGNNKVLVLGGPAVAALGLSAPAGQVTTIGNYIVVYGANSDDTILHGLAAAKALSAG